MENRIPMHHFFRAISLRRLIRCAIYLSCLSLILLIVIDRAISYSVRDKIYTDINTIPPRPYAVLLGTAKYVAKNSPNLFYDYRLEAAKALFDAQKITYLLLSGDNSTLQYNEPRTMKRDLRRMGISEQFLFPDYAGFRTLDSIIRAKYVFQAEPMTIISQRFHCERALFIAKFHQIDAICFAADQPPTAYFTRIRESFARLLMLWEVIIEKSPRFLGEPEPLPRVNSP
ncbi:MAG: ElyC/SanA/YdcF family protein [Pasteurellaceae bacterium]|nr:ElyC/SanA/YdcF family protein [Pasteurellaceae bacterium]